MSDAIVLLPCPFCGGRAKLVSSRGDSSIRNGQRFYWVTHESDDCPIMYDWGHGGRGMETGCYDTPSEASTAWNRRIKHHD